MADDKAVYAYVPQMIDYYLGEDVVLPNVPTYVCWEDEQRRYVLEHLAELVVKAVNESGGYGMLIGPHASTSERQTFAAGHCGQPAKLHRPAHPVAVACAGDRRRRAGRPPRRPAGPTFFTAPAVPTCCPAA